MTHQQYKEEVLKDPRAIKFDFTPDGRIHYVYRVSKLKEHYYGSKTEKIGLVEETLGTDYFTSSKNKGFKRKFKKNPQLYKSKIIRYFDNKSDKQIFESYLHHYFDVKNHPSFINRSNQTPFGFDTTGTKQSKQTRDQKGRRLREWYSDPILGKERRSEASKRSLNKANKNSRTILQIDFETHEVIKEWITAAQACRELHIDGVTACARGQHQTVSGFIWIYKGDQIPSYVKYKGCSHHAARKVYQYDKDTGVLLRDWDCVKQAATFLEANPRNISMAAQGNSKSAEGFTWSYNLKDNNPIKSRPENIRKEYMWVNNIKLLKNKMIPKIDKQEWFSNGWVSGRINTKEINGSADRQSDKT